MKMLVSIAVCIVLGGGCASPCKTGDLRHKNASIYDRVAEAGFPTYGLLVQSPAQDQSATWYYYTGAGRHEHINATGPGRPYGLWVSHDNGLRWRRVSNL